MGDGSVVTLTNYKFYNMLRLTVTFLAFALLSSIFGFGENSSDAATIGKVFFFVFLALCVLSMALGNVRSRRPQRKIVRDTTTDRKH